MDANHQNPRVSKLPIFPRAATKPPRFSASAALTLSLLAACVHDSGNYKYGLGSIMPRGRPGMR